MDKTQWIMKMYKRIFTQKTIHKKLKGKMASKGEPKLGFKGF